MQNHVGKNCKEYYDPNKIPEIEKVNSVSI